MSKRLGQHFLKNKEKIKSIVDALNLEDGDTVVEIGPGNGAIIKELRKRNKELRIVGIEKDPDLVSKLASSKFIRGRNNIEIIEGDVLELLPKLTTYKLTTYKLVGNIPYYLTGKLLRILGEIEEKPKLVVFTVQKEVAERAAAKLPKMNILGATVQSWAEVEIIDYISRTDFRPEPEVDSAVIKITSSGKAVPEKYFRAVKILFRSPRKTILNNLSDGLDRKKDEVSKKIKELGLNPKARPQDLSVGDIKKIIEML